MKTPKRRYTWWIAIAVLVAAAIAGLATSAFATSSKQLTIVQRRAIAALPAHVADVVQQMGADPASAQHAVSGNASVYLFKRGDGDVCAVLTGLGASGSCDSSLGEASGSLRVEETIVDGKLYVWGLVRADVTAVRVTPAAGTALTPTVANGVFVTNLNYTSGGVGPVTVTVTRADGSAGSTTIPAIPAPPGS
jgi:hypothetical protein